MNPSLTALAIYILGRCGYTPHEVKYKVPIYEINQIMHAHMVSKGVILEWLHYEEDEDLTQKFERIKEQWLSQQR